MAYIHRIGRRGMAVAAMAILLHIAGFWAMTRTPPVRPPRPDTVRWIQGVIVASPPPPRRAEGMSLPAPMRSRQEQPKAARDRGSRSPGFDRAAAPGADAAPAASIETQDPPPVAGPPSTSGAPPIDLSPESLGRALGRARAAGALAPPRQWHGEAADPFGRATGPAHLGETVGASGSRVTRVENGWGTYCVRTPPPGRAPVGGPGPEMALPTRCP